ncbi:restriction endonuclease subunit S [Shewanella inventionis]|uniref:restriction endonuclease subunit S n=1 Tax=Shewanella inventionis TaxID=1738770 RepID=UPI0021D8F5C8|nr:restriction endonuclease subunit S [Shewanella inventionis]UAL43500.1 restriction endonuclease subunit S [Shewanella inventionis]
MMKIADFCKTAAGGTPLKNNKLFYTEGNIPWLLSGEVGQKNITETKNFITQAGLDGSSAKIFPVNSILIAMYGATAGEVGILRCNASTNQAVCAIYPNEKVIPEYLYYFFLNHKELLVAQAVGNAQPNISQQKIKNTEIELPLISEQKRIVAILDQAFAEIEQAFAKTEQNLENVRELFESYLQQVFTAGINEGKVSRLEDLCTFSSGSTPSKKNDLYWGGNIPWMSGRDMKSTQLFNSFLHISQLAIDESTTRIAPKGTILILVRGMGLAHGAQVSELMVPSAFNQDIKGITPNSNIVSRYLVFALRHRINFGDNILSSAAHGTLKINMDELKNVVIPVPLKAQQEHLVSQFDILIEKINCLESIYQRKLANLNELKKSILQKAFAGELSKSIA